MKFAVTGLFRSRTKWASVFLSTPECPVIHDATFEQIATAQAVSTPLVLSAYKWMDTRIAYIDRPVNEVILALRDYDVPASSVRKLQQYRDEMLSSRDVLILDYNNFDAHALWEYCHGTPISQEYVDVYENLNMTQQSFNELRRTA